MSKYELITDLCESKVFRSRQALDKMGKNDKNNLLYATLLSTLAGSLDFTTSAWAKEYAGKTAAFSNFDHFRPSATDLYVLLYSAGPQYVQQDRMIRMLRGVNKGTINKSEVQQVLLRMERALPGLHPRLKTARRTIVGWETASPALRRQAAQDLILTTQQISRRSETLPYMKQLKNGKRGMFTGRSSTLKKAAAVAGAGLAGFWLGRKLYDPTKEYSWTGRKRESIELGAGNMLTEDRATQLAYIAQKLPEHPAVEKLISVNYLNDGISAFVRTKDGNAYEFEIRPAPFAKGHEEKRGVTEDTETQPCTWCDGRGVDDWNETCFSCGGLGEVTLDGEYAGDDLWEVHITERWDDELPESEQNSPI